MTDLEKDIEKAKKLLREKEAAAAELRDYIKTLESAAKKQKKMEQILSGKSDQIFETLSTLHRNPEPPK